MSLQHTEALIFLVAIPLLIVLFWMLLKWKKSARNRIGDPMLVDLLIRNYSPLSFKIKFILACCALFFIIGGMVNIQSPGSMEKVRRKGVDVMVALDVSKSMLAEDSKPSRLENAKQLVNALVGRLENDRIGLVLFAGRAYMQMPLTTDHASARMYVQNASPAAVPTQGTVIAEALKMSNAAFNSKERKYKAVVLITDGEDHDPEALKMAQQLSANGIMIITVGIGSSQGATIPDPSTGEMKKDELGNTVISKLNEQELQQLAGATEGIYIKLQDIDSASDAIIKQLNRIETTALEDNAFRAYKSYFQWFLAIALILMIAELLLPEKKWRMG